MKIKLKYLPCIVLFILPVLLWIVFGTFGSQRFEDLQHTRLTYSTGLLERTGEDYGIMNEGPALTLVGGTYTIFWDIETDADNLIRISATGTKAITPTTVVISAEQPKGSAQFTSLDEIYNLQIQVDYQAGSYMRVNRIDLVGPAKTDRLFSICVILFVLSILAYLHASGRLTSQLRGEIIILTAAILFASIPLFKESLHGGHDAHFHYSRLLNLVNGLREGQFPVRIGTFMQLGYGAITSVYYPELFLYIPALMIIGGVSFVTSFRFFFLLIHIFSALSMRYAAGKLFSNRKAGLAAAVLYTLSQYRLVNVYTRFALGEALAMCVLPLFLLGLYEAILGDKKRWKLLGISAALLCQTHLITTAICGCIAVGAVLIFSIHLVRTHRISGLIKSALLALLLNLFYLIPLYTYSQQGIQTVQMQRNLSENAISPAQLFLQGEILGSVTDPTLSIYAYGIGTPLILLALFTLYTILTKAKQNRTDRLTLLLCTAGVAFSLMSTTLFPWNRLSSMTHNLVEYIQFPWRMLGFATLCFALTGGYALKNLIDDHHADAAQFMILALCVVCTLPLLSDETRKGDYIEANKLPPWDQRWGDYTLPGANFKAMLIQEPIIDDGITIDNYSKYGTTITANFTAQSDGQVVFPMFAFDGFKAEINGEKAEIKTNEHSHIALNFSAGSQGSLRIYFEGNDYWCIGDVISLFTLLLLSIHTLLSSKRRTAHTS